MNLFQHQSEAIKFSLERDACAAFYHEVGLGKTLTAIETFRALRVNNPDLRMLVVCPIRLIHDAWGEDIQRFTTLTYKSLRKILKKDSFDEDILICNYEWLRSNYKKPLLNKLLSFGDWMIVCDESQIMKNHRSQTTRCLHAIAHKFKHRIVMSGTPAPNDESEYWSQIRFLNENILHKNFFAFRNSYFHLQRGSTIMTSGNIPRSAMSEMLKQGFKYALNADNKKKIIDKLETVCHFRQKKDCLDLPEMLDRNIHIDMDPVQASHYRQMKNHMITQITQTAEAIVAKIALTKLMKLRQITSGFSIDEAGGVQNLPKNPKLDALLETLEQIGNHQVIIWCNFRHEIETLASAIVGKTALLYGGVDEESKSSAVSDFKAGRVQYLIAHPKSAGVGLTFTNCSNQIFYSLSYSFEDYEQCRGRTHRAGQKNPCMYYHLLCKDTIDEEVLSVVQKKKTADELLKNILK